MVEIQMVMWIGFHKFLVTWTHTESYSGYTKIERIDDVQHKAAA